jgi:formylglycine-generating enzyme required for sulfatase activity/energy-coupling factor transporter ATP-binding protein EcfA2
MKKETLLIIAAGLIFAAALLLFLVSWFVQPALSAPWNSVLVVAGLVVAAVLAAMSGIADTLQIVERLWGKKEGEQAASGYQAAVKKGSSTSAQGEGSKALGDGALDVSHSQVGGSIYHQSQISAEGDVIGGDQYIQIAKLVVNQAGPDQEKLLVEALGRYLQRLGAWCNALPLAALGSSTAHEEVTLAQVYVELDTETRLETEEDKQRRVIGRDEEKRLSALAAVTEHSRLVLLGNPGSGKSSFVQWLAGWLARSGRGEVAPPEGWTSLLPLFVRLRDLAPVLADLSLTGLSSEAQEQRLVNAVVEHWQSSLRQQWHEPLLAGNLKNWLQAGRMLLIFDGLDEVAESVRGRVPLAVRALLRAYPQAERVIVTCRVRSYTGTTMLPGFHSERLAPFDREKIRTFIEAWYTAQKSLTVGEKKSRITDLQEAATKEDLMPLAENPMLLTTMAIIHQQQTRLPRQRVRVYDEAVKILLYRWQQNKGIPVSTALQKVLEDPRRLRQVLERLGYEAHQRQAEVSDLPRAAADLPRSELLVLLEDSRYLGEAGLASEFLDYVDQRSGLLAGYGGDDTGGKPQLYSFVHRTFQEYLAGCHMLAERDPKREYLRRLREGDYWYLAAQLGAEELLYIRRGENSVHDLAYALCPVSEPTEVAHWRGVVLSGHLANLLGKPALEADEIQDGGAAYVSRIRRRLTRALSVEELTPIERAEAGRHLAQLEDTRREVLDVDAMPFGYVPEGPFWLGSDDGDDDERPAGQMEIPYDYWLGQNPVSQAQFAQFVAAGGYGQAAYWPEAAEREYWREDGRFKADWESDWRTGPYSFGHPYHLANHPVVGITWYEAIAFCRWLTERWQAEGWLPEGWRAQLPSEVEWEKGARGGLTVPTKSLARPVAELIGQAAVSLVDNPYPQRPYPWGKAEITPNIANYGPAGIKATSSIGCFPGNHSPYGLVEMSGTVWEWTRSKWGSYPYQAEERERLDSSDDRRVLRGGSYYSDNEATLRCASRGWHDPNLWYDSGGFRVCVSPFPYATSDL